MASQEEDARRKEALALKEQGNQAMHQGKFNDAVRFYSDAIAICEQREFHANRCVVRRRKAGGGGEGTVSSGHP